MDRLSWKSTHRARDRDGALERQQSIVLEALWAAAGRPVSYEQLRAAGVEFPASVVSELELAGVQVERCRERIGGTRQVVGVRLYEASRATRGFEPPAARTRPHVAPGPAGRPGAPARRAFPPDRPRYPPAPEGPPRPASPRVTIPRVRGSVARAVFLAAPALMLALVIAALATSAPGGAAHGRGTAPRARHARALAARPRARTPGGRLTARVARSSASRPTGPASAAAGPAGAGRAGGQSAPAGPGQPRVGGTPVSETLAEQLEAQGHELLGRERGAQAIPVLRQALAATGESLAGCLRPASEPCLTYAYALYDLGRALLSSGSAAAAVSVLEHRLRIENQQPVVAAELESARRRLG